MKNILILFLICINLSATLYDKGPAYNLKHSDSEINCSDIKEPSGVSDCADSLLWSTKLNKYFDRCCYFRYQLNGKMIQGCTSITEEQYLDIAQTIREFEEAPHLEGKTKVYQLDCASSYLKIVSISSFLLALFL